MSCSSLIFGLTGPAGAGKDTIADVWVLEGFRKIAFADALYQEVATAFGVTIEFLKDRAHKESPLADLALTRCADPAFVEQISPLVSSFSYPLSPREILQWWGTEYRRRQSVSYWTDPVRAHLGQGGNWVVTDIRFADEADTVRAFGGLVVRVQRDLTILTVGTDAHASEAFWRICQPDIEIVNDGSLEALRVKADVLLLTTEQSFCDSFGRND